MPKCLVLGDAAVQDILINLSRDDIVYFRNGISRALCDFSATQEREYQPDPAVVVRPDGRKTLFRLFTSEQGPGVKIIVSPNTEAPAGNENKTTNKPKPTLHGILAVCDEDGFPKGFVNAEEITAYRTAMSAIIPYSWRSNTANIVVFGAGKTALWHVRLALALRGEEVKCVTVVNRSIDRARSMVEQVQQDNERIWKSPATLTALDPGDSNYEQSLQEAVGQADVIFCTTPASSPVFPAQYLTKDESARHCFISAIGSWQANMIEIDPALVSEASQSASGIVVCDDRSEVLKSSGEIIQSGLRAEQITELGELLHMRGSSSTDFSQKMQQSLQDGFVVYKSVGLSLTDLAAANIILPLAEKQGKGVVVPDF
ncbi:hypothetical protein LTR64_005125 [Lithohypha guttulata]|uniref:uncharacterized protein n=1 Tax=Lithohypha guttulata TaxID=1690604 RepID=UPI002DDEF24E|nr:hypothetical protein LTR51_005042 [Lithohypha guttulata]